MEIHGNRAFRGRNEEKNELREVIKEPFEALEDLVSSRCQELFKDRDCATMVRPVADEGQLRRIQELPYEQLRPQFRSQVEAFVKKACSIIC